MSEWIKCSDKLPGDVVLVFVGSPSQAGIGYIDNDKTCCFADGPLYFENKEGWSIDGDFENGDTLATHWQPLPPPPAE
jgi:hypothetical protein